MSRRKFLLQSGALIAAPLLALAPTTHTRPKVYGEAYVIGKVRLGDQEFSCAESTHIKRIYVDGKLIWKEA